MRVRDLRQESIGSNPVCLELKDKIIASTTNQYHWLMRERLTIANSGFVLARAPKTTVSFVPMRNVLI